PSSLSFMQKQNDKITKSPITSQQTTYQVEDDEMDQVVTSNAVDYNTNDSKYMYDDFTENDYIATGDIITTSTVTPTLNTHYTNSFADDGTNILNNQILVDNNQIDTFTDQLDIPVSQNTLTSHKTNLYCDSTAYDLIDTPHHDDEVNTIGNNNYLRDHMYNDRLYNDTSENIVFNQNQLDHNPKYEVYREDFEDDVIQNQGLKTGYNDNYNNQYQTPYYSYQEDYFNEEDEYKYLEEEREEAANLEHQKQLQDDQHYQEDENLDKLDEIEDHESLDNGLMGKHDEELETIGSGYHSDEDATLDDNKMTSQITSNKGKKRHLTTQESISDTEFFSQRFDGPGLKNLNKQESIIEEEESTYQPSIIEVKPLPRISTTREQPTGPLSLLAAMTTTTTAQALQTKQPGDIVSDMIGS
ncbi:probable ATP-dependent helicase PF08_0048, partial [Contarinia nasturtii]|uniref:probable ATP-dependent helicase PF08_0048 n=1 Tax=Contarinia nasturtii TaxID=265458 RepID=UPI0012D42B28